MYSHKSIIFIDAVETKNTNNIISRDIALIIHDILHLKLYNYKEGVISVLFHSATAYNHNIKISHDMPLKYSHKKNNNYENKRQQMLE